MAAYWDRRLSRRRALRAGGGAALGASALFMLACGGGGSSDSGGDSKGQQLQGKITVPVDTSAKAKRGGIYQYVVNTDETNLDPFTTTRGAGSGGVEKDAYQRLLKEKEFA